MAKVKYWMSKASLVGPTLFMMSLLVKIADAQSNNQPAPVLINNANQLTTGLFCPIINTFFWVVITVSVIMALWAAFTYVTASDDTEKTTKARKILLYAAIGIVVALIANGFPALIATMFPNASGGLMGAAKCG